MKCFWLSCWGLINQDFQRVLKLHKLTFGKNIVVNCMNKLFKERFKTFEAIGYS